MFPLTMASGFGEITVVTLSLTLNKNYPSGKTQPAFTCSKSIVEKPEQLTLNKFQKIVLMFPSLPLKNSGYYESPFW